MMFKSFLGKFVDRFTEGILVGGYSILAMTLLFQGLRIQSLSQAHYFMLGVGYLLLYWVLIDILLNGSRIYFKVSIFLMSLLVGGLLL